MNNYGYPYGQPAQDMLTTYKSQYQMPQGYPQFASYPQPQGQPNTPSTDIIWVMGEAAAQSYPVARNTTITLWDKNTPTIYIKSVDGNGVPSMRTLDFTERENEGEIAPKNRDLPKDREFITTKQFDEIKGKFEALKGNIDDLYSKYEKLTAKKTKKEVENDG